MGKNFRESGTLLDSSVPDQKAVVAAEQVPACAYYYLLLTGAKNGRDSNTIKQYECWNRINGF